MYTKVTRTVTVPAVFAVLLVPAAGWAAYDHSKIDGPFTSGAPR